MKIETTSLRIELDYLIGVRSRSAALEKAHHRMDGHPVVPEFDQLALNVC